MTYDEFKTYLATFLWKDNDQVLIDNLDSLIQMADAELNQLFKVQQRLKTATISVDNQDFELPSDYRSIRDLTRLTNVAETYGYVPPTELYKNRVNAPQLGSRPVYSLVGSTLLLSGDYTTPTAFQIVYYDKIPDYQDTDASWVADDFLNLYVYAVLRQTVMFLREDERLPLWNSLFTDALKVALQEDAHERARGVINNPRGRVLASRR
ncbi:phage adaptor protein [Shimia aestuarii]|uniref:Uncharacterized protein n=1 Tax=Shimia aestuarii TaxID=254406 RepID=A0A1I4HSD3_9RHOB|nr:hypothetical protein [Shimia aestuarii]SFL44717.1 hypothetical protein SAMN04488042_101232 [Shimia aestuarii]